MFWGERTRDSSIGGCGFGVGSVEFVVKEEDLLLGKKICC